MNARKCAWEVLCRMEKAGQYSNLAVDAALRKADPEAADRALFTALVYGVIEKKLTLDACIDRFTKENKPDPQVRNLLRLGIYQLLYFDKIPDHAAVNETVALAPRRAAGYVNAILRNFLRSGKQIPLPDREKDPVGYLSVAYSVGRELCARLIEEFGEEKTESLLRAVGEKPDLCLFVNTLRVGVEELRETMAAARYESERIGENGLRIAGNAPVTALPGFAEGWFFVQDIASQNCVRALDPRPGMKLIDVCSCPGSKSFGAAIRMENKGEILSCDLHASKLPLVEKGAARLGISIIETKERDARNILPEWVGKADRVICDVPCSGFGVIAKKPELRYKDPAESVGLPIIQAAILKTSSALVAPGGKLVYSTCTILSVENHSVVADFLQEHPEFSLIEEKQTYPDTDGVDGFYYAILQRTGGNP